MESKQYGKRSKGRKRRDIRLNLVHKLFSPSPEPWHILITRPKPLHSRKLQLHRFFLVGSTGRRSDLGVLLPSGVLAIKGGLGFDFVWEGKEFTGEVECGLDILWRYAMIAERTT